MASPDKLASGVGFHSFRIPAVVRTSTGRILAFAEGRRHNNKDFGDINLVYKRTKTTNDNGEDPGDWESLREVVATGPGTWGNPTAVVDGDTVYLFLSWNGGGYSQNGGDVLPDGTITKKIDSTWAGQRHQADPGRARSPGEAPHYLFVASGAASIDGNGELGRKGTRVDDAGDTVSCVRPNPTFGYQRIGVAASVEWQMTRE
ncbi:hypothetical protein V1515DRAFT_583195 [Lipomyces mesembrius]